MTPFFVPYPFTLIVEEHDGVNIIHASEVLACESRFLEAWIALVACVNAIPTP